MPTSDNNSSENDTLGKAANRYVTFRIVSAVVGAILFLVILFAVFLPLFHHVDQAMPFSGQAATPSGATSPGGAATLTINGRPATPEEQKSFERYQTPPTPGSGSQSLPPSPR